MLNPNLDQSAVTRFNNDLVRAQQATMPLNQAAQASLRVHHQAKNKGGPPVGSPDQILSGFEPPSPVEIPTGGPQLPHDPNFTPALFKSNPVDELVGRVRVEHLFNSPEFKDASEITRLKNMFNRTNPIKPVDNRNFLQQTLSRLISRG